MSWPTQKQQRDLRNQTCLQTGIKHVYVCRISRIIHIALHAQKWATTGKLSLHARAAPVQVIKYLLPTPHISQDVSDSRGFYSFLSCLIVFVVDFHCWSRDSGYQRQSTILRRIWSDRDLFGSWPRGYRTYSTTGPRRWQPGERREEVSLLVLVL